MAETGGWNQLDVGSYKKSSNVEKKEDVQFDVEDANETTIKVELEEPEQQEEKIDFLTLLPRSFT